MIKLILADDHSIIREALSEMLTARGEFEVVAQANNGIELIEKLKSHQVDIVIMDMSMPGMDGLATLKEIKKEVPSAPPVLVLSALDGEREIRAALKEGAKGYIHKNTQLNELVFAIQSIVSGKTFLSPSVTSTLISHTPDSAPLDSPLTILSKREVEILTHLADGKPNREIGKILHISTRTVDTHRTNILKKLGAKTNAELVKIALANDLISL